MKAKPGEKVADFFQGFIDNGRAKFGEDRVLVGTQEDESQTGIELPSFSLQYLLHSNIIPLSKIIGLAGAPASSKSGMLFELFRLFIEAGGVAHLVETENKLNVQYLRSIVGGDKVGRVRIDPVKSVQLAQDAVTSAIEYYKDRCPDRNLPLIIGIDSLAGSTSDALSEEITKAGHAEKSYPEAALLWSNYFKVLCSSLTGLPITVAFTNHLKDKIDAGPAQVKTKGGGVSQDFHALIYLYMTRIKPIDQVSREGNLIKIQAYKCGLGPSLRVIEAPILWDFVTPEGATDPIQTTTWDWNAATGRLFAGDEMPKRILDKVDITSTSNRYSSRALGVSKVTDSEIGAAIAGNAEMMTALRQACGYRLWNVFGKV
jgi:RecA/RadA recombinase